MHLDWDKTLRTKIFQFLFFPFNEEISHGIKPLEWIPVTPLFIIINFYSSDSNKGVIFMGSCSEGTILLTQSPPCLSGQVVTVIC